MAADQETALGLRQDRAPPCRATNASPTRCAPRCRSRSSSGRFPRSTSTRTAPSVFVDGGMLSNFPVDAFDRAAGITAGAGPRSASSSRPVSEADVAPAPGQGRPQPGHSAMLGTMQSWSDQMHLDDPAGPRPHHLRRHAGRQRHGLRHPSPPGAGRALSERSSRGAEVLAKGAVR